VNDLNARVIEEFRANAGRVGGSLSHEAVFDAERAMSAAVEEVGVSEGDGNEFGGGEAVLYAYGANAEALYEVMEPTLRGLPFRPAYVVLRRGSRETESQVDL
jgi:hypothetical protein